MISELKLESESHEDNPYTDCRMYENEFPEVDDLVMVRVTRVTEIGAYVNLLEYNNKEGIILLSNLSRKRIRSVNRHVRVGKIEVLQVLRVDTDKGYIDLSKKLIQKDDILECQEKYKKSKTVHSILSRVAQNNKVPLLHDGDDEGHSAKKQKVEAPSTPARGAAEGGEAQTGNSPREGPSRC